MLFARVPEEIRDDEKVRCVALFLNNRKFIINALLCDIGFLHVALAEARLREPPELVVGRASGGKREVGEDPSSQFQFKLAHIRNARGILKRLGQISEKLLNACARNVRKIAWFRFDIPLKHASGANFIDEIAREKILALQIDGHDARMKDIAS